MNAGIHRIYKHADYKSDQLEIAEIYILEVDNLTSFDIDALHKMLSDQESLRADRFVVDQDRNRYVAAHGALRYFIGAKIGLPSQEIIFGQTGNQKPSVANSPECVEFNISKSGRLVAIAFSNNCSVGIDIECVRPIDNSKDLLASCLSEREEGLLQELTARDVLTVWTLKEAVLKATGEGLYRDPRSIAFSGFPPAPVNLSSIDDLDLNDEWYTTTFEPYPNYVGAIAARLINSNGILSEERK